MTRWPFGASMATGLAICVMFQLMRFVDARRDALPRRGGGGDEATSRSACNRLYMPCCSGSAAMSADISTTGFLLVFFHQCDRPPCSTDSSPVLCTIGTWQWLEYSVMAP